MKKKIKSFFKKVIRFLFPEKRIVANIVTLAPSELLQGRCALITGGTSGIGYEIAKSFMNAGAKVVITGRNQEKTDKIAARLQTETGVKDAAFALEWDNTQCNMFEEKFRKAIAMVGHIDILVNNAGLVGGNIDVVSEEQYDAILNTNLKGVFFLSKLVSKYMKENHIQGNILNVASSSSLRPAISAYTLSKWGLRGLTLGLAKMLAPYGITVNGIAPGPTATPMLHRDCDNLTLKANPTGRFAMPQEIANMAVMLCSGMGRMVVGDIVYMTGGAGLITVDDIPYNFTE